jgi:hypothetical protein
VALRNQELLNQLRDAEAASPRPRPPRRRWLWFIRAAASAPAPDGSLVTAPMLASGSQPPVLAHLSSD